LGSLADLTQMIITRTPLRISFAGGGTDFSDFYRAEEGAVISAAIDKFIYVIVKDRFDDLIHVSYSKKETVRHIDEIQHDLVREAMRKSGVLSGVEIATMADIPSEGSGLGSSSCVLVGLLNALHLHQGMTCSAEQLAQEACEIEIDVLGRPIGKQDHYIAAYGGLRSFRFLCDDTVTNEPLVMDEDRREQLASQLMLFYTGMTRQSGGILQEQRGNIASRLDLLRAMRDQVEQVRTCLRDGCFDDIGTILHEGWRLKRQLAGPISNSSIDRMYELARKAGATGGKIAGAGGGGFMLLYCPLARQEAVRATMSDWRELHFRFERAGSRSVFNIKV
jgi:D-glycero-alpha-D-manno-heptose-7-phosphate kinase